MLPCLFLAVTIIAAEQLRSFWRKIRRRYHWYYAVIGCFLWSRTTTNQISILSTNYACRRGMQVSQSGRDRTHRRRRPPSCMIVTAMIVTVSPQWIFRYKQSTDGLTDIPWDKMAAISQKVFSDAFSWMKNFVFWLKFHWSLFIRAHWKKNSYGL